MIASRFDYSFSLPALIVTALVVIVYFVFVFRLSAKEYQRRHRRAVRRQRESFNGKPQ